MTQEDLIGRLELEWEDAGFFGQLRSGSFDEARGASVLAAIAACGLRSATHLERRLVSLLWYLPLFAEWQTERVQERGGAPVAYRRFVADLTTVLEEELGVP